MTTAFDPTAPLPGPPDPWAATDQPTIRSAPPFHMTDMIAAEPALARRIVTALAVAGGPAERLATAIADAARAGSPIVVTGCGTSEHAALGVVEILRDAMRTAGLPGPGPSAAQAFELSLDPPSGRLLIAVSHEGATIATNAALSAARANVATTALLTGSDRSPGAALADIVLTTGELDRSWCHTVGYLSPLAAAVAVGAHLTGGAHPAPRSGLADAVAALLSAGARDEAGAERIAAHLSGASRLIVIASGADRPAGRELVLKVEEASWLPSAFRDLETFLHGHLPATDATTGLVVILTDRRRRAERFDRTRDALAAARAIGIRSAAIVAADLDSQLEASLTPAGRLIVAESPELPAPVAALVGTTTPLQLLTERIARARGTNPDPIRRDDPRYRSAADAAEGGGAGPS
jgi:glucosamine--fructose-6-phosphate aminotransferase (isomerizing)